MPVFQLTDQPIFPDPDLAEANGLLAVGGDLSPQRLLAGYRLGIFPWYSEQDPILWWFTSPRLVLFPNDFRISRRLNRYFKNTESSLTINKAFVEVINACAETRTPKRDRTWISAEMITAYTRLHQCNYCHSVECWQGEKLVGGLYGVALGKVFFGESMFSTAANSSKFALIHLVAFLKKNGYRLIDCQMTTPHLIAMGARELSGRQFRHLLHTYIRSTIPDGAWPHETRE